MDEQYIKMMSKAWEIQEEWKPTVGDWFYKEDGIGYGLWLISDIQDYGEEPYLDTLLYCAGERMHSPPFGLGLVEFRNPEGYIWLPTQAQLQAMVIREDSTPHPSAKIGLLRRFVTWVDSEQGYYFDFKQAPIPEPSMEALWLAFVMKEKYGKTWNGNDWIDGQD